MLVPDRCLGGERGGQSMCYCTVEIDHTTTAAVSMILCREASDVVALSQEKKKAEGFGAEWFSH